MTEAVRSLRRLVDEGARKGLGLPEYLALVDRTARACEVDRDELLSAFAAAHGDDFGIVPAPLGTGCAAR